MLEHHVLYINCFLLLSPSTFTKFMDFFESITFTCIQHWKFKTKLYSYQNCIWSVIMRQSGFIIKLWIIEYSHKKSLWKAECAEIFLL